MRLDSPTKIVVTGGSGQLGTLVLERLVADRTAPQIVSLDLVPPVIPSARLDWRIADLRDPGLERHLEGADALVHLAFLVVRPASKKTMEEVNVEGSKRLFEAAARHGIRRIVYSSSVAAYGALPGHPVPIVETTLRRRSGTFSYADNKYDVEEYLDAFERAHPDVSVARVRPGILFGRRVAHMSEATLKRRIFPILGAGRAPIVWDEDVAEAIRLALVKGARGAYNLVAEDPLPGEDLARLAGFRPLRLSRGATRAAVRVSRAIEAVSGEKRFDPAWIETADVDMIVSAAKARTELGWKPRYPTSADVAIAFGKNARGATNPRVRVFLSMLRRITERAAARGTPPREARELTLTVHVDLTGRSGTDFTASLAGGVLSLRSGIPRPPDGVLSLSPGTFLSLLSGALDPETALASRQVQVRGEPDSSVVLAELVRAFREAAGGRGISGTLARRVSGWFERGSSE